MKITQILEYKYRDPSFVCETEKYNISFKLFDYVLQGTISLNVQYREGAQTYAQTRFEPAEYEDNVPVGFCDYDANDIEIKKVIDPNGNPVSEGDYYLFEFSTVDGTLDLDSFMVKTVEQFKDTEIHNDLDTLMRDNAEDAAKMVAQVIQSHMQSLEKDFESKYLD